MVVTCPSCSARYRLNPDKMKGRGAKITCPKCAHVFVVFADGAAGSATDNPDGIPALGIEDTLRERLARRDASTTHSALKAIGFAEDVERGPTSSKIRVVAPGPRGSRKPVAMLDTNHSLSAIGEAAEGGGGSLGPVINSADELDFREVGITTWKVKVAIGLVYDFSDIATLKRYLADKRVTEADLLSYDGKEWTVIGEIPDLDAHFIDTWKAAFVLRKGSAAVQKPAAAEATEAGNYATSTGRMGALSPSGHHSPVRSRPRKRRAPKKPEKKSGNGSLALLAGILVIGGVGYFLTRPPDLGGMAVTPSAPAASSATATDANQDKAEQDRIRKGVKDAVARQREKMMADERAAAAAKEVKTEEAERDGVVDLSKMEAVRPAAQTTKVKPGSPSAPLRSPASRPRSDRRKPPSQAFGGGGAKTSVQRDDGGSMWLAQGNKALAAGNYGSATTMFQQCVHKNAASGECWAGLGKSLQRTGKSEEATAAFDRATALGVRVNRSGP